MAPENLTTHKLASHTRIHFKQMTDQHFHFAHKRRVFKISSPHCPRTGRQAVDAT
jgi:hypothetical protein